MGFLQWMSSRTFVFLLTSSLCLAWPELPSPLGPVVNLGYVAFAGNTTAPSGLLIGPVTFYGGMPFAQPPVADLRFRAPARLNEAISDSGNVPIIDARSWGPPCIQQPAQVGVGEEDCLKINVWKPSDAKEGDKLPVVFYIHGGGFYERSPQSYPLYDIVNQSNPKIVGVSAAYRLNLFGFLAGNEVQSDGDLNVALLDQYAALEWVQRHIAQFGGDPDEVTIVGESAGACSVVMQMVSYGGSKPPLFKRAIAQSIGYGPTPTEEEAEAAFQNVTEVVGCPSSGSETMPCLRNASLGSLINAINQAGYFLPVLDGPDGFLPDLPNTLISAGRFHTVEFIGGHCTNDGRTFVGGTPDDFNTDEDIASLVFERFGTHVTNETIQKGLALYPAPGTLGSKFTSQYDRASTIAQDIVFSCMDWAIADKLQQQGVNNVYTYRFNSPDPVLFVETPYQGVMHTSDLFYLFSGTTTTENAGTIFTPFNNTEAILSEESIAFWSSFVSFGDPSIARLIISPEWVRYASGERMILNQSSNSTSGESGSVMESTPLEDIERCKFWMSLNVTSDQTRI